MFGESKLQKYAEIQALVKKDIDSLFPTLYKKYATRFGVSNIALHRHNGSDSQKVDFENIVNRVIPIYWTIPGTQAATATNYGAFFIAPFPCTVIAMTEIHQTAGTNGGAVTLQLEKLTGTTAPDSGVNLLKTALSLKGTAETLKNGTIVVTYTGSVRNATLATGDRLCLKDSGTLTSVANVSVMVLVQY